MSRSELMVVLFDSSWFFKCGVMKSLCELFGDIKILLQGDNLQVTMGPDQLTHATGQYSARKRHTM
jgi:hypothetical protein